MTEQEVKDLFLSKIEFVRLPEGKMTYENKEWSEFRKKYYGIVYLANESRRAWCESSHLYVEWSDEWAIVIERKSRIADDTKIYKQIIITM